ncbi:hypothetical protein TNCV_3421101 [Trichonephila clavipes]|nr:hypothetical protein TNCV_3421101 [Trichonephila clavipes]
MDEESTLVTVPENTKRRLRVHDLKRAMNLKTSESKKLDAVNDNAVLRLGQPPLQFHDFISLLCASLSIESLRRRLRVTGFEFWNAHWHPNGASIRSGLQNVESVN